MFLLSNQRILLCNEMIVTSSRRPFKKIVEKKENPKRSLPSFMLNVDDVPNQRALWPDAYKLLISLCLGFDFFSLCNQSINLSWMDGCMVLKSLRMNEWMKTHILKQKKKKQKKKKQKKKKRLARNERLTVSVTKCYVKTHIRITPSRCSSIAIEITVNEMRF